MLLLSLFHYSCFFFTLLFLSIIPSSLNNNKILDIIVSIIGGISGVLGFLFFILAIMAEILYVIKCLDNTFLTDN